MLGFLFAAAVAGVEPSPALCSCRISLGTPTGIQLVDSAGQFPAIFIGRVARIDTARIDHTPGGQHVPEDQTHLWARYHVVVERSWRAPEADTVEFRGGVDVRSSCDPPFRLGEVYLVFARWAADRTYYRASHCTAAAPERVPDVVAALDRRRWP